MRLIDADELKDMVYDSIESNPHPDPKIARNHDFEHRHFLTLIEFALTIEAEPVRHGRWEECDWVEYDGHSECVRYPKKGRVCTNCRNAFKKEFIDDPRVHYCPHCGAEMDGGADGCTKKL